MPQVSLLLANKPSINNVKNIYLKLKEQKVTHLISVERSGKSKNGNYYNMRGHDISKFVASFDYLFQNGAWSTSAFADGGNEIGMGNIDDRNIAEHVKHGETIACLTKVDNLVVCGVSNWGAYALISSVAIYYPSMRSSLLKGLSEDIALKLFEVCNKAGAVDGVTKKQSYSVDGIPYEKHLEKLLSFQKIVEKMPKYS